MTNSNRPITEEENRRFAEMFRSLPGPYAEELLEQKLRPVDAVPTGFRSWDRACRDDGGGVGLARCWHVIVAGRSGAGKSIAALHLAREAVAAGEEVFYASLEMSAAQLATRWLAIASDTPIHKLEKGAYFDRDAYTEAVADVEQLSSLKNGAFQVNQKRIRNLDELLRTMRWAREYRGSTFFITDYIQLAARDPNDPSQVCEVSHEVRGQAIDFGMISVALSQFNRETSKDNKNSPTIYGLMGGSTLENDSDQVVMIDHSRFDRVADGFNSYLIHGKNRHGPTHEFRYHFNARTLRMFERDEQ